jgi:hypothetical protein
MSSKTPLHPLQRIDCNFIWMEPIAGAFIEPPASGYSGSKESLSYTLPPSKTVASRLDKLQ